MDDRVQVATVAVTGNYLRLVLTSYINVLASLTNSAPTSVQTLT